MDKSDKNKQDSDKIAREKKPIQGKIVCRHCSHAWETRSTLGHVMCPSCGGRNKNPYGLYWKQKKQLV